MEKIEILDFHNLQIKNAFTINKALCLTKFEDENSLKVLFVREPYSYFNYFLYDLIVNKKTQLFTEEIINYMENLDNETFLNWLDLLNMMPLYNPQVYQLDIRKRISVAKEKLEAFDYVIPYEEINLFVEKVAPNIIIERENVKKLKFSLDSQRNNELTKKFISKDLALYRKSQELWTLSEENDYKPLGLLLGNRKSLKDFKKKTDSKEMQKYKGLSGRIRDNFIAGWVFHKEREETIILKIYNNNKFLCMAKADKLRKDLITHNIHPTGKCGFEVVFDKTVFKRGDKVEIKIIPDNTLLPFAPNVKEFLGS